MHPQKEKEKRKRNIKLQFQGWPIGMRSKGLGFLGAWEGLRQMRKLVNIAASKRFTLTVIENEEFSRTGCSSPCSLHSCNSSSLFGITLCTRYESIQRGSSYRKIPIFPFSTFRKGLMYQCGDNTAENLDWVMGDHRESTVNNLKYMQGDHILCYVLFCYLTAPNVSTLT